MTEEDDIDGLAAEYVLGSLDPAERANVDARRKTDASLAAAIEAWQRRLGPLNEQGPGVEPPAHLLDSILSRISGPGEAARSQRRDHPLPQTFRAPAGVCRRCRCPGGLPGAGCRLVHARTAGPPPGDGHHPRRLRQSIQGLLGELRPPEIRADARRAARRREPHGATRLRCVRGRRRAGCQQPVRAPAQDVVLAFSPPSLSSYLRRGNGTATTGPRRRW